MGGRHAARSQMNRIFAEVARFGVVGGLGIVVNMGAFNALHGCAHMATLEASVTATVIAVVGNYLGLRWFAYRGQGASQGRRELTLFALFSLIGLVIENGVLFLVTSGLGWDSPLQSNAAKFSGIGIATLFRFWSYRSWVFRALPKQSEPELSPPPPAPWPTYGGPHDEPFAVGTSARIPG